VQTIPNPDSGNRWFVLASENPLQDPGKATDIYEGSEPFVFISYSHKDTPFVKKIIKALDSRNIRVWYDAGIEAGSEWPEYIANHLTACACVLCFISRNYADSDNCRRELTFSLNLKKPILSLYMEQFQMSAGLQLQLGLVQAVFRDRFPTIDALVDSIVSTPLLAPCRADGKEAAAIPVQHAEPASVQQSAKPNVTNYLKRATMALEDGEWSNADAFCEQALNLDPENADAYLIKLLAEMKVQRPEQLAENTAFTENNKNYKKLLRFADEALTKTLALSLEKAKAEKERQQRAQNAYFVPQTLESSNLYADSAHKEPYTSAPFAPVANTPDDIARELLVSGYQDRKLEAIKILREKTGLGLKEAKEVIDKTFSDTGCGTADNTVKKRGGCYVATCVYGSYDCPQVWTLRRFRDNTLARTRLGRVFIRTYYAISPRLVKWFGNTKLFKAFWGMVLEKMVTKLQSKGVENTPYDDKPW